VGGARARRPGGRAAEEEEEEEEEEKRKRKQRSGSAEDIVHGAVPDLISKFGHLLDF
jgi:hypothetical protein